MSALTIYTPEIADYICERIANSVDSLSYILADHDMPDRSTVYRWLKSNTEFREQYTLARMSQRDMLIDDIIQIADNINSRVEQIRDPKATFRELVKAGRMQIDARKWVTARLRPKKYFYEDEKDAMNDPE
jgi:hypothetical protein